MNYARDFANTADLRLAGWRVIRVWECEIITKAKRDATLERLYRDIVGAPVCAPWRTSEYQLSDEETLLAAEATSGYSAEDE